MDKHVIYNFEKRVQEPCITTESETLEIQLLLLKLSTEQHTWVPLQCGDMRDCAEAMHMAI